jgi:2,3-bisphosphoglycerate-independent phosphoglycerate mutase
MLCILDGWGYSTKAKHNAVVLGRTPHWDALWGHWAQRGALTFLSACEKAVGLPVGQIGNSEVGHMNIGAGRVVYQDICTIDNAVEDGSLKSQAALVKHIAALKRSGGTCHLMGIVSPGGVHSLQAHMAALANEVKRNGVPVVVHAFTDGRDVPPQDAVSTMPEFLSSLDQGISVVTVTGRYYAMDRDNRWERVGQAYDVIVQGKGKAPAAADAVAAIKQGYAAKLGDEFILPTVVAKGYKGIKDGDGILMANFRADRAREILLALADPSPPAELGIGSTRPTRPKLASVVGMVKYSDRHANYMEEIFPVKDIRKPLGEVAADAGLAQLRVAETEKYPHVTFFFNGGRETPFPKEDRILVPSPKVATYDLQPEMSCPEVGRRVVEAIDSGKYNLIVLNFANPDMVGHTGKLDAAIKAVESVDVCLGNIVAAVQRQKGVLITTADHGNCEQMWDDETNEPHTAHTLNKVPCILSDFSGADRQLKLRDGGALCDLAPTILQVLGVKQPKEMTGKSLIV